MKKLIRVKMTLEVDYNASFTQLVEQVRSQVQQTLKDGIDVRISTFHAKDLRPGEEA